MHPQKLQEIRARQVRLNEYAKVQGLPINIDTAPKSIVIRCEKSVDDAMLLLEAYYKQELEINTLNVQVKQLRKLLTEAYRQLDNEPEIIEEAELFGPHDD